MKPVVFLLVFLSISNSNSFASTACFQKNLLPFFQNFNRYQSSENYKIDALENTCRELRWSEMHDKETPKQKLVNNATNFISFGLFLGTGVAAFSKLKGTREGRVYIAELERIKRIPNPIERVRLTYELAGQNSGKYDYENGLPTWISGLILGTNLPDNLLANAKSRGTVGVCREFANLLYWSLNQVSRFQDSRTMALSENDFSSELVMGETPGANGWSDGGGHAWVRVNVPNIKAGKLVDFTRFDLDSTWYPETFTPLFPRHSGLTNEVRRRAINECQLIINCLVDSSYPSNSKPSKARPTDEAFTVQ